MNYEDLRIYQLAQKLQKELYKILIDIPYYWRIPEVDQVIRSSSSATSNIVEGYGRKIYPQDFYRFLTISLASSDETQNHIVTLHSKGHLNNEITYCYRKNYKTLSIQTLNLMIALRKKYKINNSKFHN